MNYIEITIKTTSVSVAEITIAMLGDYPFDSFDTDQEGSLRAYIPEADWACCKGEVGQYLGGEGLDYLIKTIEQQNWNQLWESNFDPIDVEGRCLIRAPFHSSVEGFEQQVVIMPKMSFGTGHHATTYLMVAQIMDSSLWGLEGLDMGSGTGVLAILAAKMGAKHIDAIDIDLWAQQNAQENIETNGVSDQVTPLLGDASLLEGRAYDFILANINRNILLHDMVRYNDSLRSGGFIIFSGLLEADIAIIIEKALSLGLCADSQRHKDGWVALRFQKP